MEFRQLNMLLAVVENVGDKTLYWYGTWRAVDRGGVRMCSWDRDRLGMLKPFRPDEPQAISCPITVAQGRARIYVNASGLGQNSQLRIGLVDRGFRPIPSFSGSDAAVVAQDGLRTPVAWKGSDVLLPSHGPVRVDIRFAGVRPEDCRLHAVYVAD